jgi:hypothetical protein
MRFAFAALALLVAACSPPASEAPSTEAAIPRGNQDAALLNAVSAALMADLGTTQGVSLTSDTIRTEGDWGWVVAQPQNVDWSQTKYASAVEHGVFDGNGTTYALLQRENGVWVVRAIAIGPTDLAYATWPQEYGAPASLMGLE